MTLPVLDPMGLSKGLPCMIGLYVAMPTSGSKDAIGASPYQLSQPRSGVLSGISQLGTNDQMFSQDIQLANDSAVLLGCLKAERRYIIN